VQSPHIFVPVIILYQQYEERISFSAAAYTDSGCSRATVAGLHIRRRGSSHGPRGSGTLTAELCTYARRFISSCGCLRHTEYHCRGDTVGILVAATRLPGTCRTTMRRLGHTEPYKSVSCREAPFCRRCRCHSAGNSQERSRLRNRVHYTSPLAMR